MSPGPLIVCTALLSLVLVAIVRRYALRGALLDLPSQRSSHRVPTPRGAGLGVVAASLVAIVVVLQPGMRGSWSLAAALCGTAVVAVVGWLDDHGSLPVAPRLTVHLLAGLAVAWLALGVPGPFRVLGLAGATWWVFWTVSAINVTNFMDGIDGFIGLQVLVFGVHIVGLSGRGDAAVVGAVLAGAASGFLVWNWPPARIFLGDVGSAAMGVLLVIAGVLAERQSGLSTGVVFLPLFPMFLDASVTLVRRWYRGERLTEAHRSHLYQRLANGGWGHARVTLMYGVAAAFGSIVSNFAMSAFHAAALLSYFSAVAAAGIVLDRKAVARVDGTGGKTASP